jgi:hypothetical protein
MSSGLIKAILVGVGAALEGFGHSSVLPSNWAWVGELAKILGGVLGGAALVRRPGDEAPRNEA